MTAIAIPDRRIALPRFEFPRWLKHGRGDRVSNMLAPLGGMLTPLGVSASVNPLASVPWVAQWKFNNNGNDSIGSNHLTNNNSATFTTGKLGGATGATALVAASSQCWTIAHNSNLATGNVDFMVAAWVYLTDLATDYYAIGKWSGTSTNEYDLYFSNNRFRFSIAGFGKTVAANTFGLPSAGTWYLLCAWHDATNDVIKICVNAGTADSTATAGTAPTVGTSQVNVGAARDDLAGALNGRLDNVLFAKGSGAVPTQAVLDALYNSGNGTETLT